MNKIEFKFKNALKLQEKKEYAKALKILIPLAQNGFSKAQRILGESYLQGIGVNININKSIFWFTKASEQNDAVSFYWLGFIYEPGMDIKGMEIKIKNHDKSKKFYELAVKFFQKDAEDADAEAMRWLAICYQTGSGITQNFEKAIYWFERALEHGNLFAANDLFTIYSQKGTPWYDEQKARGFYDKLKRTKSQVVYEK